jgi:hypothetical protein
MKQFISVALVRYYQRKNQTMRDTDVALILTGAEYCPVMGSFTHDNEHLISKEKCRNSWTAVPQSPLKETLRSLSSVS